MSEIDFEATALLSRPRGAAGELRFPGHRRTNTAHREHRANARRSGHIPTELLHRDEQVERCTRWRPCEDCRGEGYPNGWMPSLLAGTEPGHLVGRRLGSALVWAAAVRSISHCFTCTKDDLFMSECPPTDGSAERQIKFDAQPPMCIDVDKTYTAVMDTSMGSMTIVLDPKRAPLTVNNFVFLARYKYYDSIIFHRIINGFVCQGGDPEGSGRGGPGYRFADELPSAGEYEIGSVAMANAGPNTNGSQFFLISGPSGAGLPPQYSLFGKITEGLDVLEAMQNVPTGAGDRPKTDVVINSVTVSES